MLGMGMGMGDFLKELGSNVAALMVAYTMFERYFPSYLRNYIKHYVGKFFVYTNNYVEITVQEFLGEYLRNPIYTEIDSYLSTKSPKNAMRLKAQRGRNKNLVLTVNDNEVILDEFQEAKLFWSIGKTSRETKSGYSLPEKQYLVLKFHKKYRDIVTELYLNQITEKGRSLLMRTRQRRLYSNSSDHSSHMGRGLWNHVVLDHPATFDNLAMDPTKKKEILDDLISFGNGKDYYAKVGKAWKRGYLLYGPPGTGKSTMVAAMANFLNYDIYDLELTAVKGNSELRKLLLDTSNKSVIVIEDIDCTMNLTNKRQENHEEEEEEETVDELTKKEKGKEDGKKGVTLSGLLNFIDGLWSTCGSERLIVFTTNHIERLDPALIRRGRMDMHIEMSYICFEGFKVLAKNYLNLDSHILFDKIRCLISETEISPADVAENLMPKNINEDQTETCLKKLIQVLEKRKEDAILKVKKEKKKEEKKLLKKEKEAKEGSFSMKEETIMDGEEPKGSPITKDETEEEGRKCQLVKLIELELGKATKLY